MSTKTEQPARKTRAERLIKRHQVLLKAVRKDIKMVKKIVSRKGG